MHISIAFCLLLCLVSCVRFEHLHSSSGLSYEDVRKNPDFNYYAATPTLRFGYGPHERTERLEIM